MKWFSILLLLLPSFAFARTIVYDAGGPLRQYANEIRSSSENVEILDYCASACTMWLEKACVHPNARLIFHGPVYTSNEPMPSDRFDFWSAYMSAFYPPLIATWFMQTGRFGSYMMTGQTAIYFGARACE